MENSKIYNEQQTRKYKPNKQDQIPEPTMLNNSNNRIEELTKELDKMKIHMIELQNQQGYQQKNRNNNRGYQQDYRKNERRYGEEILNVIIVENWDILNHIVQN